jgi:hypothetical protein
MRGALYCQLQLRSLHLNCYRTTYNQISIWFQGKGQEENPQQERIVVKKSEPQEELKKD